MWAECVIDISFEAQLSGLYFPLVYDVKVAGLRRKRRHREKKQMR
jgi:hypothetical protein